MAKDFYETLGVKKDAGKDEIKKAFYKQAHKYHPDKKEGNEAKFKEVNEAYQVLSDDTKRKQYDTYGSAGPGGAGGFDSSGFSGGFEGVDLNDIFGDFFGGGFGGSRGGQQVERGNDIQVDIELTFEESIFGVTRNITLGKTCACETCHGSGAKPGTKLKKCTTCDGKGKKTEMRRSFLGTFQTTVTCSTCHGKGEIPEEKCKTCNGQGVYRKQEAIEIPVPKGIQSAETLRMSGKGEAVAHGVSGDLYVRIHVKPHKVYRREGANLIMTLEVKTSEAILGATHTIYALDGKPVEVKIPAGLQSGDTLRLKDRGVPTTSRSKAGDILIHVRIKTPTKISNKAKKLIEELQQEGI